MTASPAAARAILVAMRPLLRAALIVAAAVVLVRAAGWVARSAEEAAPPALTAAPAPPSGAAPCPPHTLPDQGACVPVPGRDPATGVDELAPAPGLDGDHIPLLPNRPADPSRYRWPLPLLATGLAALPFPLEPPSPVAIALPAGAEGEVRALRLEQQVGDAEVLFTGELVTRTVLTLHTVRAPTGLRSFVLVYGNLATITPGLARGANLRAGAPLGAVAVPSGALVLEAREVRRGVDVKALAAEELRHPARTVAVDLRNLLEQLE